MQIRSRIVAREIKSGNRPGLYAGALLLDALKAIISIAASHNPEFSLIHVDASRAYFHAKAHRLVLVKLHQKTAQERIKEKWTVEEEHQRGRFCNEYQGVESETTLCRDRNSATCGRSR